MKISVVKTKTVAFKGKKEVLIWKSGLGYKPMKYKLIYINK
jgi:hypothetical protein